MIKYDDIPNMTIRDIVALAEQIRVAKPSSRKARQLSDRMCAASWAMEGSGALQQLLWWAQGTVDMESPPDAKAKLFVMPVG